MFRIRVFALILALAVTAAACSSDSPTSPTSESGGDAAQPSPGGPTPVPSTPTAPAITAQPKNRTVDAGGDVTLTVTASGGSLSYQWYVGTSGETSSPVGGAKSESLTTPKLTKTTKYWVRVSNGAGSVDSETATVTVKAADEPAAAAPAIASQPKNRTIASGQTATLSVTATGTGPLSYRWYQGTSGSTSSPVAGATGASFTTPSLTSTTRYWVRVSNSAGAVDSDHATVTVSAAAPGPGGNSGWEEEVRALVNARRSAGATCGSTPYGSTAPLSMNSKLRAAARGHSQDMAANNYFSHTSQDGRTFDQRIRDAGYTSSPLGENIAAGYSSPQSVVDGWMTSPGHCRNIMSPDFRAIGVGYAHEASAAYRHYWTLNFGGS